MTDTQALEPITPTAFLDRLSPVVTFTGFPADEDASVAVAVCGIATGSGYLIEGGWSAMAAELAARREIIERTRRSSLRLLCHSRARRAKSCGLATLAADWLSLAEVAR